MQVFTKNRTNFQNIVPKVCICQKKAVPLSAGMEIKNLEL